jgi:hypothetical protein
MRKSAGTYKKLDNWIFGRNIRSDLNMLRTAVVPGLTARVVSISKSDLAILRGAHAFFTYSIGRWWFIH